MWSVTVKVEMFFSFQRREEREKSIPHTSGARKFVKLG